MSYVSPIYQTSSNVAGPIVSAAASAQLSVVELELAKLNHAIEGPEAAAARREREEQNMMRETWIGSIVSTVASE
jgi:hypothetical protein